MLTRSIIFGVMTMMCVAAQVPAPKTPEQPVVGTIEGKVVTDNGQPLAGASVFVRVASSIGNARSTTTDLEGNFRVSGLESALYLISANAPAYTSVPSEPGNPHYYRIGDNARVELIRGGAITGTVTNAAGEPVIAVRVRAVMVRDGNGQVPKASFSFLEQPTDDRGIYRIYGLAPGTYIVSAGGASFSPAFYPYDSDVPTFFPSATRDNAGEVLVRSGEDTTADIRYRGEAGYSISGTTRTTNPNGASITLTVTGISSPVATTFQIAGSRGFAFHGLAEGDYELVAQENTVAAGTTMPLLLISETKRISVKGANVTGIELVPRALSNVSGRIVLEPSKFPECEGKRPPLLTETLVKIERPEKEIGNDSLILRMLGTSAAPEANGAFTLRNLMPGRYRFDPRFYARYWYLQSITTNGAGPKPQKIDAAANWTAVKSGDQLSNLTITLAEGAASVRGRVAVAEGSPLPSGIGAYLIPNDLEKTDDVLRFFLTEIAADGTFAFNNVPPGQYLALAQNIDPQTDRQTKLRLPEAATARTELRRIAKINKAEILLKPCQNLVDYQLKRYISFSLTP